MEGQGPMLALSKEDLGGLLTPQQVIVAVEAALRAQQAQTVFAPKRLHAQWSENSMLTMPAFELGGLGVKIISIVPGNAVRGLPVTDGIMLLNDGETGLPFAIMNAGAVTAQCAGAVGALGAKYLTPPELQSLGVIGTGVQAAWQAIFASAVRPIADVFVFSRSMEGLERFRAMLSLRAPHVRVTPCCSARELVRRAALIVTATTSPQPVVPDEPALLKNKHFVSVGSYRPTMQELPDSVYHLAGSLAVDSEHACYEVGDVINPLRNGLLTEAGVFSIGDCVTGKRIVDTRRTTAYKSVGSAIYDLFVAQALYREAIVHKLGREIVL